MASDDPIHVRQPEPNRDSEAFLSALADELSTPLDDLTTRRQVEAAVAAARFARSTRRSHVTRWAAAVLAAITVFGSGGIAVAGGLPAPLQAVVADVARVLPVPFHVPYPKISPQRVTAGVATDADAGPENAEFEVVPHQRTDTSVTSSPEADTSANESEVDATDLDPPRDRDADPGRCDLEELVDSRDQLDADEIRELRDQIRQVCGFDLVDPPGWARGFLSDDQDRDDGEGRRDDDRRGSQDDRRDEERGRGDRDPDETGDRDGDFGSSEPEDSDETSESASDDEEERLDDEGNDRSSDEEWRDRHD